MTFVRATLWVLLAVWLTACPLLWVLRDGLGPDSVETSGFMAVRKFAPMMAVGAVLGLVLAGTYLVPVRKTQRERGE